MTTTTYGWNIDTKGNTFPSEFATYEEYKQKLRSDYIAEMNKAIANGTYATGWLHANCDHAYDYCVGGN
jgi:hypothetical protein